VFGRHGEPSGSLRQRLLVDLDDQPLLRHELAIGPRWPGWDGPCGVGDHRCAGALLVVGPRASRVEVDDERAAALRLDGPAVLVSAVATSPSRLRAVLDRCLPPPAAEAGCGRQRWEGSG
jgi:urease accessory protein